MFGQTLYIQWKWNRDFLAFYTAVAFAAPLIILWIALPHLGLTSPRELVNVGNVVGATTGVIAVVAGLTVAWQGYGIDDRAGHIYALSLPITRTKALASRAATAAVLLVLPALGAWVGATLAAGQASLPVTLHSYAGALASPRAPGRVARARLHVRTALLRRSPGEDGACHPRGRREHPGPRCSGGSVDARPDRSCWHVHHLEPGALRRAVRPMDVDRCLAPLDTSWQRSPSRPAPLVRPRSTRRHHHDWTRYSAGFNRSTRQ